VYVSLTVRLIIQTETKVDFSDLTLMFKKKVSQQTKDTTGITE